MPYKAFDKSRILIQPLAERTHDMQLSRAIPLDAEIQPFDNPGLDAIADRVIRAHKAGKQVVLMMGAHVIKVGLSYFVTDLMKRGIITHVGLNGAGCIHDYEMALIGATSESVARYIKTGQFGMWEETGRLNIAAKKAAKEGIGFGEAAGRMIVDGNFPNLDASILATGYKLGIPVTVHVGIGQDIIHQHPNCDGAALGAATYQDFLVFTETISKLQHGVYLNYGTAVMGPEVYLKALSMVRNVARQEGRMVNDFSTAVFDLADLGEDLSKEASKSEHRYYYRPFKTILVRTVADGGESFYIRGDHTATMPNLWKKVVSGGANA